MKFTPEQLQAMKQRESSETPCNGCTACCKQDTIVLGPRDDPEKYRWHLESGQRVLDRKPNGECTYLTSKGCGIHGAAPAVCRSFDCCVLFLITPKERRRERVEQNPTMRDVYDAGKKRLESLKGQ